MSKQIILIALLSLVLVLCIGFIIYNIMKQNDIKQQAVIENILSRKSVRHFEKGKEVTQQEIEKILRAGMAAPSARNMQPWEFVVITDKSILNSIAEKIPSGKMLADASFAIVVAGRLDEPNEFWDQDTSAVTENILLAVEAMKLGAVWIGIYPKQDRMSIISQETGLPQNVIPLNIIAIGYPTGEDLPKINGNLKKFIIINIKNFKSNYFLLRKFQIFLPNRDNIYKNFAYNLSFVQQ